MAGVDYSEDIDEVLSFNTGDTRQCYTINITADEQCEFVECESEFFNSQVQTSNPRVNLVSPIARVVINDLMELNCSTFLHAQCIVHTAMAYLQITNITCVLSGDVFRESGCTLSGEMDQGQKQAADNTLLFIYIFGPLVVALITTVIIVILLITIAYKWRKRRHHDMSP